MADEQVQCAFRLSKQLVDQIDTHAAKLEAENPGMKVSRADVVRVALTRFFGEQLSAERPSRGRKR